MEKRSYRRFTAEEKRTILEETRQPGVTLSEVCRKHSVSPALVYKWRTVAQQATTAALQQVDSRGKSQPDAQTARLLAELERMRRVVAEITAENLELEKNSRAARKSPFECAAETGSVGGRGADAATERVATSADSGVFGSAALEALPAYPQCQQALDLIGKLYDIERSIPSLRGLLSSERTQAVALRAEVRRRDSVPILGELRAWALSQHALPESLFAQALQYMLSLWEGLTRFAQDPRIPVDNNAIERDLRGVVVGRKNHYGSKSVLGTEVAATMYTLIETASRHGLNPRDYLRAVAEHSLRNSGEPLLPEPLRQD